VDKSQVIAIILKFPKMDMGLIKLIHIVDKISQGPNQQHKTKIKTAFMARARDSEKSVEINVLY